MFEIVTRFVKDRLFPVFCLGCNEEGEWCCASCRPLLAGYTDRGKPLLPDSPALAGVSCFLKYEDGNLVSKIIQAYKYQHIAELESVWHGVFKGALDAGWFAQIPGEFARAALIPIPLHPRRERDRGFNQAENLTRQLLASLQNVDRNEVAYSMVTDLKRVVATKQQARLTKVARQLNLKEAFRWQGSQAAPVCAILVDDVYTTGATLESAAAALRLAGTQKVWGITLARAV